MTDQIQLEPEAHAFAEAAARSPLLFTLGPFASPRSTCKT